MVKATFSHSSPVSPHGTPQVWRFLQSQWRLWRQSDERGSDLWYHCRFSCGTSVLYSPSYYVVTISCCTIGTSMFHSMFFLQNHTSDQFGKPSHSLPQRLHEIIYKIIYILLHLYFCEGKCHLFHQILKVVCDLKFKEENKPTIKTKHLITEDDI